MKLTKSQEVFLYEICIDEDISLQYGKLSLCDLRNFRYSDVKNDRKYQVHCDDYKYPWSMIYDELKPAVRKFVELKEKVKKIK
jgi:hypothetical protein